MKKFAIVALPLALALGACGETATDTTDETMPADTAADTMVNDDMMADDTMTDDTMTDPMAAAIATAASPAPRKKATVPTAAMKPHSRSAMSATSAGLSPMSAWTVAT